MKKLLLLIALAATTISASAQKKKTFAEFTDDSPKKLLLSEISETPIKVRFKSRKEATVYVELMKNGKLYAGANKTLKAKKETELIFKLTKYHKGIWPIGKGYTLKVFSFEGPTGTWDKKVGGQEVNNISVTRLKY